MNTRLNIREYIVVFACLLPWIAGVWLVDIRTNIPLSPLQEALETRRFEEAKRLIREGRINDYNPRSDWSRTPLMMTIKNTYFGYDNRGMKVDWNEVVNLLLASGADVNEPGWLCYSPLHQAVNGKDTRVIKTLLAHGAILDRKNCHGQTPLMIAAAVGNVPVVKELLIAGANPSIQANDGKTALEYAKTNEVASLVAEAISK